MDNGKFQLKMDLFNQSTFKNTCINRLIIYLSRIPTNNSAESRPDWTEKSTRNVWKRPPQPLSGSVVRKQRSGMRERSKSLPYTLYTRFYQLAKVGTPWKSFFSILFVLN